MADMEKIYDDLIIINLYMNNFIMGFVEQLKVIFVLKYGAHNSRLKLFHLLW